MRGRRDRRGAVGDSIAPIARSSRCVALEQVKNIIVVCYRHYSLQRLLTARLTRLEPYAYDRLMRGERCIGR